MVKNIKIREKVERRCVEYEKYKRNEVLLGSQYDWN